MRRALLLRKSERKKAFDSLGMKSEEIFTRMHARNDDDDEQRTNTMSSLTSFLHQKGVNINALFNNAPPPPDDQNDIESSELVKTIHARSKRFVAQMSPHIDAIETNVREMTSKARGARMTNALELHALIDSCSFSERSSSQTSEEMDPLTQAAFLSLRERARRSSACSCRLKQGPKVLTQHVGRTRDALRPATPRTKRSRTARAFR